MFRKEKKQLMLIHGGMTFKNQNDYLKFLKTRKVSIEKKENWKGNYLDKKLRNYQIIKPRMPLMDNSKYEEWKIHFERFFEFLKDDIILIGNSLGGIFLAKYLSENKFPKRIKHVFLVCAPYDNSIIEEDLVGGFELKKDLSKLDSKNLTMMFSKDDDVVPVSHAYKYREKLKKANIIIFDSKNGHFKIQKFPEIIKIIKRLK